MSTNTVMRGAEHPRWKGGRTITEKGYVRIKAGPDRDKFEHRAVMERLLGGPIPPGFEVHHQDFNRAHNCPCNLLLLQDVLHHPPGWVRPSWRRRKGA